MSNIFIVLLIYKDTAKHTVDNEREEVSIKLNRASQESSVSQQTN